MPSFVKHTPYIFALVACLILSSAALSNNLPRIVNGDDAPAGEFPAFANLQTTYEFSGNGDLNKFWPACGGIIIAGQYLWTADHCLVAFGSDKYFWEDGGNETGALTWNFRLVVGLEKQRFELDPEEQLYYSTPEAYNQILPIINLGLDPFDPADFFNQQDFSILNLSSIISDSKPLLINKAIYLGKKTDLETSQESLAIGFGNAACVKGDCNQVPPSEASYPNLRQIQVELQRNGCGPGETDVAPYVCVAAERVDLDNDDGYNNVSHGDSGGPVMIKNSFGDYVSYGSTSQGYADDQGQVSNRLVEYAAIADSRVPSVVNTIKSWHGPTLQSSLQPNQTFAFRLQNLTPDTLNVFAPGYLTMSDNVTVDESGDCNRVLAPFDICNFEYRLSSLDNDGLLQFNYLDDSLDVLLTSRVRPLQPEGTDDSGTKKKKKKRFGASSVYTWLLCIAVLCYRRRKFN